MNDWTEDDERECDESCLEHTGDCDGFCDHINHQNACLIYDEKRE